MTELKETNKLTGAEIIVQAFINEGVEKIFGYPGGAILPFYDALFRQNKLHHILTRLSKQQLTPLRVMRVQQEKLV